jgi:hypothetical protein
VTFDAPLPVFGEPGFGKMIRTKELAGFGSPDAMPHLIWADPQGSVVMLKPRQMDSTWVNSTQAIPWIIRLAQMDVNASDLGSAYIKEQPVFGNTADPWIFHVPTAPGFFPAMADGPFPRSDPSLTGINPGYNPAVMDVLTVRPNAGYQLPTVVPPPPPTAPPAPTQTVNTATGKHLVQTPLLPANQGLFLRWFQQQSGIGFPPVYGFYIGQFALFIKDVLVEIFEDDSPHGDRSHFRCLHRLPLFDVNNFSLSRWSIAYRWQVITGNYSSEASHDRWLMWLPYRRNQVLLYSSIGQSAIVQVKPTPNRLPDNSDWDIVRPDKLVVWALAGVWSRFQIQKLAYPTGGVVVDSPYVVLDYAPAATPNTVVYSDQDHGTSINAVASNPPSYSLPVNNADDCPNIPPGIATYQARKYGFQLTFNASPALFNADAAYTPFFYNLKVTRNPVFIASTATPHTVHDITAGPPSGATVLSAEFTVGLKPGEGKATIQAADFNVYELNNYYYRSGNPVQIKRGTTPAWTGYTLPPGVEPLKKQTTHPRRITFTASDRWWQLTKTYLRDNRDWTGTGHIDVVKTVMQEGGIDTTGIDTPASPSMNQTLGVLPSADLANMIDGRTNGPWQPRPGETAASFIQRLAQHFSGWVIGFQADGTPFYFPRYFYTSPELTFYENQAAAAADSVVNPLFYRRIIFSTIEPEANAIMVAANSNQTGSRMYSSIYVDWASIYNPAVVNYLGRYKPEIVEVFGAYSCQGINQAARTIWDFTRRRHVRARVELDYDPGLKVGHVITLHGYGNYRIQSFQARFDKQTWAHCQLEGEYVESGVGLPTTTPT